MRCELHSIGIPSRCSDPRRPAAAASLALALGVPTFLHPDLTAPRFAGAPDARFVPAPADGVLPEGFFSTTNLPTYVKIEGDWKMPREPRMDGVLMLAADGNQLALAHPPHLANPQLAVAGEHERPIHARLPRHHPLALDPDVRGQVGGREEAFGEHTVGRRGDEARIGGAGELRRRQVWMKKCGHA